MRIHHHKLRAKGWTDEEIRHAHKIVSHAEEIKHPAYRFLEKAVFWALLFLTAIGIFLVSAIITPLFAFLPQALVILILFSLGLCLGWLFAIIIPDIEWLEAKHHVFNVLVLTGIAILNIWVITRNVPGHQPWLIGGIFAIALLIPYCIHLVNERMKSRP